MLLRETMYYCMTNKQLDKRVERLGVKIKNETDPKKKIELLGDISDIVKTLIRKNSNNESFMTYVGDTLNGLLHKSESEGSHN